MIWNYLPVDKFFDINLSRGKVDKARYPRTKRQRRKKSLCV